MKIIFSQKCVFFFVSLYFFLNFKMNLNVYGFRGKRVVLCAFSTSTFWVCVVGSKEKRTLAFYLVCK